MTPAVRKLLIFLGFIVGVGVIYPLIMSGIFSLDLKTSIIVGTIFGFIGAVLWTVTSNIREKKRTAKSNQNAI
jgi:membrane associated rhomboid family serine protease